MEVFGLEIDGETVYSNDCYMIVQEILANSGCTYNLQDACTESKQIWGNGYQAHELACEKGLVSKFLDQYPDFKSVLLKVNNCNNGKYYGSGRIINGMMVFKKSMSDQEFYALPEYQ